MSKKLSAKEKKQRKEVKKFLINEGLLPPRKKPLNRKNFLNEVRKQYLNSENASLFFPAFTIAVGLMIPHESQISITAEEIGMLKILKAIIDVSAMLSDKREFETLNLEKIFQDIIIPIKEL